MSLMASTASLILNPIISVYARDYINATVAEIGLIVSVFFIVSIFFKPIVGLYCQGMRTLYALWIGLALMTFPTIELALVESPIVFGVLRIIQGIGNSMLWAPAMTLVTLTSTRESRERDISNYSFLVSVGMSLGPALGSMGVATLGMRNTSLPNAASL